MTRGILYSIAINDLTNVRSDELSHYYQTWTSMLSRCYGKRNKNNVCYAGVTVCEEWLTFSKFKSWMEIEDWRGKELDKDLLIRDNKVYSPLHCCFIPRKLNAFLTTNKGKRGEYPLGVRYRRKNKDMINELTNCFQSEISLNGKIKHLGYFSDPYKAHLMWQKKKLELTKDLLYVYTDTTILKGILRVIEDLSSDIRLGIVTKSL